MRLGSIPGLCEFPGCLSHAVLCSNPTLQQVRNESDRMISLHDLHPSKCELTPEKGAALHTSSEYSLCPDKARGPEAPCVAPCAAFLSSKRLANLEVLWRLPGSLTPWKPSWAASLGFTHCIRMQVHKANHGPTVLLQAVTCWSAKGISLAIWCLLCTPHPVRHWTLSPHVYSKAILPILPLCKYVFTHKITSKSLWKIGNEQILFLLPWVWEIYTYDGSSKSSWLHII